MNLDRKLMMYAAATAAGVTAATDSAQAEIVFTSGFTFGSGSTNNINFDNAGNEEYVLGHRTGPNRVQLLKDDQTIDANAYAISIGDPNPAALSLGTTIGPGTTFSSAYDATIKNQGDGSGNFTVDNITGNPQYVGVRFQLVDAGPLYYGWIGIDITDSTNLTGQVTGFAYNNVAGNPIAAGAIPEPSGLALLALGAPLLLLRRRKRA